MRASQCTVGRGEVGLVGLRNCRVGLVRDDIRQMENHIMLHRREKDANRMFGGMIYLSMRDWWWWVLI
jgi:hypothetical protein